MGYSTDFTGHFTITPPLQPAHQVLLAELTRTRREIRDGSKLPPAPSWVNDGSWGQQGEFYTAVLAEMVISGITPEQYLTDAQIYQDLIDHFGFNKGQDDDMGLVYYNESGIQPSLWLQWVPQDSTRLVWDEGEKFYNYVEWLIYLIKGVFRPNGYTLNGRVEYQGEDLCDNGYIEVTNNQVNHVETNECNG